MKERLNQDEIAVRAAGFSPAVDNGRKLVEGVTRAKDLGPSHDRPQTDASIVAANTVQTSHSEVRPGLTEETSPVQAPREIPAAGLLESITHAAATVRRFQADSVALVLKPDAQTEISLRLTVQDGKVEALARCERGDFNALNAHWPELRQSLEHQGVRLLELQPRTSTDSASNAGWAGFSQQHSRQFAGPEDFGGARGPSSTPKTSVATAVASKTTVRSNHLFESWA